MLNLKNRGVFWKEKPDCYVKMVWGKRPNASQPLTVEEKEILWQAGKLGKSSPVSLVHTMWFLNIQYFGLRGVQEHTTMTMEIFFRKVDDNGTVYIEFLEDPTKCRGGGLNATKRVTDTKMFATGGERCPVSFFDFYVSKRPVELQNTGRFYLIPKGDITDEVWFSKRQMGHNSISKIMKRIVEDTPVSFK